MKPYIKSILPHLKPENCDARAISDQLYRCYQELHPCDSDGVKERFSRLDHILRKLPLREYDCIWDLTCQISAECERAAFLEGLWVGIQLSFGEMLAE